MPLITPSPVMKANTMKHSKYIQHGLDGPYTPAPTLVDKVLFWLSGFVCGLIFALLITGN
jgi:hypothetical protein